MIALGMAEIVQILETILGLAFGVRSMLNIHVQMSARGSPSDKWAKVCRKAILHNLVPEEPVQEEVHQLCPVRCVFCMFFQVFQCWYSSLCSAPFWLFIRSSVAEA